MNRREEPRPLSNVLKNCRTILNLLEGSTTPPNLLKDFIIFLTGAFHNMLEHSKTFWSLLVDSIISLNNIKAENSNFLEDSKHSSRLSFWQFLGCSGVFQYGTFLNLIKDSWKFSKLLEFSRATWNRLKDSIKFWKILEKSRAYWKIP